MKKRILSLFMAATMLLSLVPMTSMVALAADEVPTSYQGTWEGQVDINGIPGFDCTLEVSSDGAVLTCRALVGSPINLTFDNIDNMSNYAVFSNGERASLKIWSDGYVGGTDCMINYFEGQLEHTVAPAHTITNGSPESDSAENHGYITVDKTSAAKDDTVTVEAHPADGYQLKSLTVVPTELTFKAVYNTTGDANTLTFYYDAVDHSGENITVYENGTDNYLFDNAKTKGAKWGYNGVRKEVKSVVIDESVKNYAGLTSTAYMFGGNSSSTGMINATNITGVEYLNVSQVTDMDGTFKYFGYNVGTLTTVPDVSKWDTGNVANMQSVFYYYGYSSTVLNDVPDVSEWNTEKVTNMYGVFSGYGYTSTALNIVPAVSKWNTEKVANMKYMFYCYGVTSNVLNFNLDLFGWSVANVTDYNNMFDDAGASATTWSVTIPKMTGEQTNDTTHWYVGDGTDTEKYIEPASGNTFTLAAPASEIKTIADVLATVAGTFPTSEDTAPPANGAWVNGDNLCYIGVNGTAKILYFSDGETKSGTMLKMEVQQSGNDYTYTTGTRTYTFVMQNGKLTSIIFNDSNTQTKIFNGTYEPTGVTPPSPPADQEVKFELQEDGTYQFTMPDYAVTVTAEFEEIPAPAHTHGEGDSAITFDKAIKTFADLQALFTNGGSGYLANDIECTEGLTVAANVDLCLNDKVLNLAGKGNINVTEGKTFKLYDCGTTVRYYDKDGSTGLWTMNIAKTSGDHTTIGGVITGGNAYHGGGVDNHGDFIMEGGSITGNIANTNNGGGGGVRNQGSFTMNGGCISGNSAGIGGGVYIDSAGIFTMKCGMITDNTSNTYGGGVSFEDCGNIVINGGSITNNHSGSGGGGIYASGNITMNNDSVICGNTSKNGAGVYISRGTFTMNDAAQIRDNAANSWGGGVIINDLDRTARFTMNAGVVSGNTASEGGGIYHYSGDCVLGGSAKITDNKKTDGTVSNFYLPRDKYITLGTKTASVEGNGIAAPAAGLSVGVTTQNVPTAGNPVWIALSGTAEDAKYFFSDNAYYVVKFNTDHLELDLHPHTPVKVNGQAATEEAPGWSDYYECSCGDCFEDAEGLIPIENLDDWKAQGGSGYIPSGKEIKAARETAKEWFENPFNSLCLGYYSSALVEAAISGLDNITRVEDIEQYKADYISTLIEAREEAFEKNSYSAMKTEIEELCEALGFDNEKTAGILADFDEFISGEYNNETRTEAIDAISEKYGNAQNDAEKEKAVRDLYFSMLLFVNSNWIGESPSKDPDAINKALVRSPVLFENNDKIADAIESGNLEAELMVLLEYYSDYANVYTKAAGFEDNTTFDTIYAALRNAVKASAELTKAKKAATEAIVNALPEYATDEAKAIAEQAAKDIEAAETVSKVEEIKSTAINEIQTVMADVCPHCGKVHKNIFYKIYCCLIRIFKWIVSNVQKLISYFTK